MSPTSTPIRPLACLAAMALLAFSATARAQDDPARPRPADADASPVTAEPQDPPDPIATDTAPPEAPPEAPVEMNGGNGVVRNDRRPVFGPPVRLAFDDVSVEQTIPFIAESTGKVVMPVNIAVLRSRKITLLNDEPIDRALALDLLFTALRLNGIGVVERGDVVIIDQIENLGAISNLLVLDATENVMERTDTANIVIKIFSLEHASADEIADRLQDQIPDYATVTPDGNSNQIMVRGDVELCQRIARVIEELDRKINSKQVTFRLAHADASEISDNILDLYEGTSQQPGAQAAASRQPQRGGRQQRTPSQSGGGVVELRVTVNALQNSVTVRGEPPIVDEISELIENEWDLPRSPSTAKVYPLENSDPIVVRDTLNELLGDSAGGAGARGRGGAGAPATVGDIVGGVYKIEALPDVNGLLVIGKTEEVFEFFDTLIAQIDQPSSVGVPVVVPLKHADAIQLAEELNVLLAESGAQVSLPRPATGLTGAGIQGLDDTGTESAAGDATSGEITFPWQRAGGAQQERSEASSLIGRVRLVPIVRRNAVAVLAPPAQREAVVDLIEKFDLAGRQVMISAIIAEIELNDELSLGVRFSNGTITPPLTDARVGGSSTFEGEVVDDILGGIFDTSLLTAGVSVNFVIQALAQYTNVRILQQPILFTADNQEAAFFDGQDVPLFDGSTTTAEGFVTEDIDRRPVGVILNVRPRITADRDVDLEIRLTISSIVTGQTIAGSQVIDRRETATHIIVQNEQTVVISGILRDEETKIKRKIPLLGDIPLIGELFTQRDEGLKTTELVAFVTPRVVDDPSENSTNFHREYTDRLDELTSPLKDQSPEKWREDLRDSITIPGLNRPADAIPPIPDDAAPDEKVPDTP